MSDSTPTETSKSASQKLGLFSLIALTVGAMVGGGIWSLPQNMADSAALGAIVIAWGITALGMWMLTQVFADLRERRPELEDGVYTYAKAGFGGFVGFNSAWGYWVSAWIGNVSYAVLMFSALGYFFPAFGAGNTLAALVGQSIMLWVFHGMVLRGVREAAFINLVASICKVIPIVLFLILVSIAFRWPLFSHDIWGSALRLPLLSQIKSTMLVTAWVFVGIEGALVESSRARKAADVSRATFIGFALTLILYVAISVLSFGIVSQSALAHAQNPSMAYVLEQVIGKTGALIVTIGLVLSLLGAWLNWTLLCVQLPFDCARGGGMPRIFAKENKNASPAPVLWLTNGLIQVFLVITFFSQDTYLGLVKLATSCVLVPYLLCALYAVKLHVQEPDNNRRRQFSRCAVAIGASLYAVWILYAAGAELLLQSTLLYALGIGFYVWAKREAATDSEGPVPIFYRYESVIAAALVLAGLWEVGRMLGFV
ncbi:Arginine/ornithine antiporter [BD1-7 clade bacterium]|uniref:Arginine/ornithine antiporter n=1 Tax=BD1-7 clade bacterium TaxID=2029982 RepID=A0A5S9P1P1_9GAMM|nr:Arginine/ornithine antiporter [BD1-7 clade bacterium]CAA0116443.1 Arginine/ornithine antiporter [BD1-7 clade bacterium]CAA0120097.1 Arginine/ornithine antiporter [BD1-7 clade bacterium]